MPGVILIVIALLAFPIVVGLSTAALAGVIGHSCTKTPKHVMKEASWSTSTTEDDLHNSHHDDE